MEQVEVPAERTQDPFEKLVAGYGLSRDGERVPMRWDASANGGFTTGEPWLPLGSDVAERNVEVLRRDRGSLLWLYRELVRLRRDEPALTEGDYQPLRSRNDVFLYRKAHRDGDILVALNLVGEPRVLQVEGSGDILLSTRLDTKRRTLTLPLLLRPDEGIVVKLKRGA
jgi:alpha-glucosidase